MPPGKFLAVELTRRMVLLTGQKGSIQILQISKYMHIGKNLRFQLAEFLRMTENYILNYAVPSDAYSETQKAPTTKYTYC